jgi:hypothetical protein
VSPGPLIPRPDLVAALVARVQSGAPFLLAGPPGSGKTTLLQEAVASLSRAGWAPVYLDLMGAASSPERFVASALAALPAEWFGRRLAQATEIRRLAGAGRAHGVAAVEALFALWAQAGEAAGRPVALLLDEATEIRSLAYFAGLRQVDKLLHSALVARQRGTVLATSFPTLARRSWPKLEALDIPPLTAPELAGLVADPAARETLTSASFGWPRYLRVLLERHADGSASQDAWVEEMEAGGRLEAACRHTYESLLLRSRGYGISKAALAAVAEEEGLNLTALVGRIGRTPGAVRDYLQWLVGVDALRMQQKRYYYVDGLLRLWVRLHARGVPPTARELRVAAAQALGDAASAPPVEAPPAEETESPRPAPRHESLMEID